MMSFFYSRFLRANPLTVTAVMANPPTTQTEIPVSARFDDDFSGFLMEADDDAVTEAPEDAEPVDGVLVVDGVVAPPVPVPVSPGVAG